MTKLKKLYMRICAVSVLRELLEDRVIRQLTDYLALPMTCADDIRLSSYSRFVYELSQKGSISLAHYVQRLVFESENIYVRLVGRGKVPGSFLTKNLREDLKTFDELAALTPEELTEGLEACGCLPGFAADKVSISDEYMSRIGSIGKYGYGIYAGYKMFYIGEDYSVVPVQNPDSTRLCDLVGYKREQQKILDNTRALLKGMPAANILLTGDAGTGKSSTVKAVVNELASEGLRIIEIRKNQLHAIPKILDLLSENPLKFILFIDDLSYTKDDDGYSALKAVLEGSVSAKSGNVVIYATSNRRHIVKESFSDRNGDDVHFNDTMQEVLSLSERFGIQISFSKPDKSAYLEIVHSLADKAGIEYDSAALELEAERFVLKRGNRSARAAKQFVDSIISSKKY